MGIPSKSHNHLRVLLVAILICVLSACDSGDSQDDLQGYFQSKLDMWQNNREGLDFAEKAITTCVEAIFGDDADQYYVATWFLAKGFNTPGVWFMKKSAEQNFPHAMIDIALMYLNGHGVPEDFTEYVRWTKRAADLGVDKGSVLYGTILFNLGDLDGAFEYFLPVAEDADMAARIGIKVPSEGASAQYWVAVIYARKDQLEQSGRWHYKAAVNGNIDSQAILNELNISYK